MDNDYFVLAGTYPFGEPGEYRLETLLAEAAGEGIAHSWVSPLDGLYARHPGAANEALLRATGRFGGAIRPVPLVDPSAGTFAAEISAWRDDHGVAALRLAPNFHGYDPGAPAVGELLTLAGERRLAVFIARHVEDERFQPPCLAVGALPLAGVIALAGRAPRTTLVLNGFPPAEIADLETIPENCRFDAAAFDKSFGAMERCVARHGAGRFVYGSGRPFLCAGAVRRNILGSGLAPVDRDRLLNNTIDSKAGKENHET